MPWEITPVSGDEQPGFGSPAGNEARKNLLATIYGIARVDRLWLPSSSDSGTTTVELSRNEGTINWQDNTTAKNITTFTRTNRGSGQAYTFDGSDDNGELSADSDVDSRGDGVNDTPFAGAALINLTANAGVKSMLAKVATSNGEWRFSFDADEKLHLQLIDESATQATIGQLESSAGLTPGAWALVGFGYDGSRASSGIRLWGFLDGGSVRGQLVSAASESGTYIAMENLAQAMQIGADGGGGTNPFNGQIAFAVMYAADIEETYWETLAAAVGSYHGLNLV